MNNEEQEQTEFIGTWKQLEAARIALAKKFENKKAAWAGEVAQRHIRQAQERLQPFTRLSEAQLRNLYAAEAQAAEASMAEVMQP